MTKPLTDLQLDILGQYERHGAVGQLAAAEIRELRKQIEYHRGKWRGYEQDWILPLQKLLAWEAGDHIGESVIEEVRRIVADNTRLREACKECIAHCGECNGTGTNMLCGDVPCKTCSAARAALKEPDDGN